MSEDLFVKPPERPDESWETTVRDIARDFAYPPTPDVVRLTSQRLVKPRRPVVGVLKWAAVAFFALMVVIISVPEARAFVTEIIRIGAIQIFIGQPTATATLLPAATGTAISSEPLRLDIASALYMPNETTLEDAIVQLKKPIQLPTYPADIGKPDHVYVQHFKPGVLVTLVWVMSNNEDQVWLTLDILDTQMIASKFIDNAGQYRPVEVKNTQAQFLSGLHEIGFFGGNNTIIRKVNGNVLIWLVGKSPQLTYRLEGEISQEEAIRIAESMTDAGTP